MWLDAGQRVSYPEREARPAGREPADSPGSTEKPAKHRKKSKCVPARIDIPSSCVRVAGLYFLPSAECPSPFILPHRKSKKKRSRSSSSSSSSSRSYRASEKGAQDSHKGEEGFSRSCPPPPLEHAAASEEKGHEPGVFVSVLHCPPPRASLGAPSAHDRLFLLQTTHSLSVTVQHNPLHRWFM